MGRWDTGWGPPNHRCRCQWLRQRRGTDGTVPGGHVKALIDSAHPPARSTQTLQLLLPVPQALEEQGGGQTFLLLLLLWGGFARVGAAIVALGSVPQPRSCLPCLCDGIGHLRGQPGVGCEPPGFPGTEGYPRVRVQHFCTFLAYPERLRSQPVLGEVEVEQAEIPTEDSEFLGDELEGGCGRQHLGLGEAAGWGRGMRLSGSAEARPAHPSRPRMSPLPATSLWMQGRATSPSEWMRPREPGACGRVGRAGNYPSVSPQSQEGWWG